MLWKSAKSISAKDLKEDGEYTEIYADQIMQVKNMEVIYEDFTVSAFMAVDGMWDPTTLQEEALEEFSLGSVANYRSKMVDAVMNFLACKQKWAAFHTGPLVQCLPAQIPPRKYISNSIAHALRLPYTSKEAYLKFKCLTGLCKEDWALDEKVHKEQMKLCTEILELGAYALPGEVLASAKVRDFVDKCMDKDLQMCIKNVRQGNCEFGSQYYCKTFGTFLDLAHVIFKVCPTLNLALRFTVCWVHMSRSVVSTCRTRSSS